MGHSPACDCSASKTNSLNFEFFRAPAQDYLLVVVIHSFKCRSELPNAECSDFFVKSLIALELADFELEAEEAADCSLDALLLAQHYFL